MPNRAERRAAERQSRKNAPQQTDPDPSHPAAQPAMISDIQLAANRANALLSPGPTTPEGKARSSRNALKHALTGVTVLLPGDDAAEYERQINNAIDSLQPGTEEELRLVQSMVDSLWRINRIKRLETGLLLKGQLECANKFQEQPPLQREMLINVEGYLKYEKSIRNLHNQEARLHRQYAKDQAELIGLQSARRRQQQPDRTQNGFEFSTSLPTPAPEAVCPAADLSQLPPSPNAATQAAES